MLLFCSDRLCRKPHDTYSKGYDTSIAAVRRIFCNFAVTKNILCT